MLTTPQPVNPAYQISPLFVWYSYQLRTEFTWSTFRRTCTPSSKYRRPCCIHARKAWFRGLGSIGLRRIPSTDWLLNFSRISPRPRFVCSIRSHTSGSYNPWWPEYWRVLYHGGWHWRSACNRVLSESDEECSVHAHPWVPDRILLLYTDRFPSDWSPGTHLRIPDPRWNHRRLY